MSTTYKLHYFNGRGRAQISRLLFTVAGIPFENVSYGTSESFFNLPGLNWAEVKPTSPYGTLPFLEVEKDGKSVFYGETEAIERYIASLGGLYDAERGIVIDGFSSKFADIKKLYFKAKNSEDPITAKTEFFSTAFASFLEQVNNQIAIHGSNGYSVGDSLSYGDFVIATIFGFFDDQDLVLAAAEGKDLVLAARAKVGEELADYLANDPFADRPF
eukprot:TRINITY_DN12_c0_g1_i1.p1 TRINITY_DN12_c0_g1~~TRINITY_DN12_c0_g1_i1.p1  ORF type:complete len:230 (+),score=62.90 TRINITY_DN12_c0_g1_i1:44-691(+)